MTDARRRTAVLISGRGSNLSAFVEAARAPAYPAEIALVVSDNPEAAGLGLARDAGIGTAVIERRQYATKHDFEAEIDAKLRGAGIELVCLAGFMRVLTTELVQAWRDRMLNIHPSLLPLFPGLKTHERALAAGVRVHGATVHFVRAEVDSGPIVVQGAVPVLPNDTPVTLAARVLKIEHRIYPLALRLVASGRVKVTGNGVTMDGLTGFDPSTILLSPSD
jgi:phosphoribosylglycinamide formyltransferase-1